MNKSNCDKCNGLLDFGDGADYFGYMYKYSACSRCAIECKNLIKMQKEIIIDNFFQPERSKREEATTCRWNERFKDKCNSKNRFAMRCSEHCRNTVRDK